MISFSQALLLFTSALTPLYLMLLVLSEQDTFKPLIRTNDAKLKLASIMVIFFVLLTFTLIHIPGFKESSTYLPFVPLITLLLLSTLWLACGGEAPRWARQNILFSTILLHILIVYVPPYGIAISERHPALTRMAIEGSYDPTRPLLHPVYNPFPMDLGVLLMLSDTAGLSPIAMFTQWLIPLFMIIAVDLVLFSLMKRLTNSWIAGVLAILILAITPPANFADHHSKFAGIMLVLISTLMLIIAFKGKLSHTAVLTSILAYVAAIFYHPTAGLGMFAVFGILLGGFLLKRFSSEAKEMLKSHLFRVGLILLFTITFSRWIYGGGSEELITSIENYIIAIFQWGGEAATPLYERAGISPIQAYAWSTPVAMATALILYIILKKRAEHGALIPSLAMVGGIFLVIGLTGAYFRAGGFHGSMYPSFGFLVPATAVVAWKTLRSPKFPALFLISLLTMSAAVAVRDPKFSPGGLHMIGGEVGGGYYVGGEEELTVARTLLPRTLSENTIKTSFGPTFSYLDPYAKVEGFIGIPKDPKYRRDYELLQGGYVKPHTIYAIRITQVPEDLLQGSFKNAINLVYSTDWYIGFVKAE